MNRFTLRITNNSYYKSCLAELFDWNLDFLKQISYSIELVYLKENELEIKSEYQDFLRKISSSDELFKIKKIRIYWYEDIEHDKTYSLIDWNYLNSEKKGKFDFKLSSIQEIKSVFENVDSLKNELIITNDLSMKVMLPPKKNIKIAIFFN
jgi:hypothetical protein